MNPKKATTAVLLAFVALSAVVLVAKNLRPTPPAETQAGRVIVYYFHGKVRCPTCESIESYAKEAIEAGYPEQLKDGRLQWRIVNYEEPENEHYAKDYELAAPCVVLVRMDGDKQADWRSLPEVWQHIAKKDEFAKFVRKNVDEFLNAAGRQVPGEE